EDFEAFWERALQDGVVTLPPKHAESAPSLAGNWKNAAHTVLSDYARSARVDSDKTYELHLYESVGLRCGRHANNPWLADLPDPLTKVTWGNVATIAPSTGRKLGVTEGDVISLRTANGNVEVPVFLQPGQDTRTISVALGHGRKNVGKVGRGVGVNTY